jgi:hypothetical protein
MVGTAHLAQNYDIDSDLKIASAFAVTAVTARPTSAATAKATSAGPIFAWAGEIYGEGTAIEIFLVEHGDGTLGFLGRGHLDKAKTLRTPAGAIPNHLSGFHRARLRKQSLQVSINGGVRQVAYIKFRFHSITLLLSVGCESEAAFTAIRIRSA